MTHVVSFSGGAGSWAAAKRVAAQHGTADLVLLFTDTIIEDNDLYRFVVEGAADVCGLPRAAVAPLAVRALSLPECAVSPSSPDRVARVLDHLARSATYRAKDALPGQGAGSTVEMDGYEAIVAAGRPA